MKLFIATPSDNENHIYFGNIAKMANGLKQYFDVNMTVIDAPTNIREYTEKAATCDAALVFGQTFVVTRLYYMTNVPMFLWYCRMTPSEYLFKTSGVVELLFTPHQRWCAMRKGRVERIRIVKYGVDTDLFKPKPKRAHDGIKILSIGAIYKNAGFIRIAQSIEDSGRDDVTYTICGNTRATEAAREYHDKLSVYPFVKIIPPLKLDKSVDLYHEHDIYVDPNERVAPRIETFRAMSCGTPSYVYSPNYYGYVPEEWFIPKHRFETYIPHRSPKEDYSELHNYVKERYDMDDHVRRMAEMIKQSTESFVPRIADRKGIYRKRYRPNIDT